ncbi:hypothetical protein NE237_012160 [Protea cynaroides]|uniref:Uncharacterized protein n=1 Tax=Protea cynaroides TaxID=273540 RepID=A0A9Q0H0J6_9MAGN|nr:hypothetical protein NE237_012160 [Protea cynaroides]
MQESFDIYPVTSEATTYANIHFYGYNQQKRLHGSGEALRSLDHCSWKLEQKIQSLTAPGPGVFSLGCLSYRTTCLKLGCFSAIVISAEVKSEEIVAGEELNEMGIFKSSFVFMLGNKITGSLRRRTMMISLHRLVAESQFDKNHVLTCRGSSLMVGKDMRATAFLMGQSFCIEVSNKQRVAALRSYKFTVIGHGSKSGWIGRLPVRSDSLPDRLHCSESGFELADSGHGLSTRLRMLGLSHRNLAWIPCPMLCSETLSAL